MSGLVAPTDETAGAVQEICTALRLMCRAGVVDYNGHASIRLAQGGFLINNAASNRAAATPEQISVVDDEGRVVEGERPPNEVYLHAAIYRARPDVQAVIHGHPVWLTTLSAARVPLLPVLAQGALVYDMPVFPHAYSISTPERGVEVAKAMGAACGAVLQGHGIVTAGPSLLLATVRALYAEQTAERQVRAAPLGGAHPLTEAEVAEYRKTLDSPSLFRKCWDYHLSI